jgi:hypothetical protein
LLGVRRSNDEKRPTTMNETRLFRPRLGVLRTDVPNLITRAQSMHDGMAADVATYSAPNPTLAVFQTLIQNVTSAQQLVKTRAIGAAAKRNTQRDLLFAAMGTECAYVRALGDAAPGNAVALIQNAGLLVVEIAPHNKPLLALKLGTPSGVVLATANVGLLIAGAPSGKRTGLRCLNWQSTIDGGKTMVNLPSTPKGKTTLSNLTPLTMIGVRVCITLGEQTGEWSQMLPTHLVEHLPAVELRAVA